ncbi:MAG: Pseudouridine synthase [Flavipsychrobacter sp.]|nr:Pseudouridine synthase [Flavipsychrobacter sp.]
MNKEQISLNKYISSSGFCSRREADKLIEQARVTINGELVMSALAVYPGDVVEVDGERLQKKATVRPIYIAMNKPVGITSTTDPKDRSNIIYFINHAKRIFPIGRLDKDSEGLIFLTNDGDIVNKILRASNHHEKEYIVSVDKAVTPEFIKQMGAGIPMLGTVTKKCFVRQEGSRRFRIILTQGLNRQIRRMCEYLDYKVVSLTRVRIMNVSLEGLTTGKWRYLTLPEINKLNEMVAESSNSATGGRLKVKEKMAKPVAPPKEEEPDLEEFIPEEFKSSKKRSTWKDFAARAVNKEKGRDKDFVPKHVKDKEKSKSRGEKPPAKYVKKVKEKFNPKHPKGKDELNPKNAKGKPPVKAKPKAGPGSKHTNGKPKGSEQFGPKQTQSVKQYIPRRK